MRTHSGEKPVSCTQCEFSFTTASHLKKQRSLSIARNVTIPAKWVVTSRSTCIHSGENPFSCTQCNYSITTADNLKRHKRTHSEEKPFMCEQCNFSCTLAQNLKNHKCTHWRKALYIHVSNATTLPVGRIIWIITCFHTLARNLLPPTNSQHSWRCTRESTLQKQMHEQTRMLRWCYFFILFSV